jgi:phosphatidylglycerophosphate synthase
MKMVHVALSLLVVTDSVWYADWAWGLLLIVLTMVIHVIGLLLINDKAERVQAEIAQRYRFSVVFVVIIGATALLATLLHGIEGLIWAAAYLLLGALPDYGSAILYSLSAITSYGHANLVLEKRWQLMGALEALNGMLVFGLTTAVLFGIIQRAWGFRGKRPR